MSDEKRDVGILLVLLAALAGVMFWADLVQTTKPPLQRAYDHCDACGLEPSEVNGLIREVLDAGGRRPKTLVEFQARKAQSSHDSSDACSNWIMSAAMGFELRGDRP